MPTATFTKETQSGIRIEMSHRTAGQRIIRDSRDGDVEDASLAIGAVGFLMPIEQATPSRGAN